jgi:hypothetical protein
MANQEHLELLKQGAAPWNEWYKQHREIRPDLSYARLNGADLSYADLSYASLNGVHLSYANLINAHLGSASLINASLNGTDLSDANLHGANLNGANLINASLNGASMSDANLHGANLNGAILSRARMSSTIIANVDLRNTRGFAEIEHLGPSPVALFSVELPQDGTAVHFLRGAGVPDEWIDLYLARMMHPIQFHSCFISYSSKDDTLARRLHADLQGQGVRCWFAPEDMKIGEKIRARIDEAIHMHEKLLLMLSEHALASAWVEDEVEAALEKEQLQQREVLFPVRLDDSVMQTTQPWAAKLRRTRHIGDFTQWTDPQMYQRAFKRLLHDLKAETNTKGETYGKPGIS